MAVDILENYYLKIFCLLLFQIKDYKILYSCFSIK